MHRARAAAWRVLSHRSRKLVEIEQAMVAKNRGELSEEGYSACMRATAGVQNESSKSS
jgi:hypothetical protein